MVHCAAINCTNSSSKRSDNTFSFFKLPKDPNRRKVWIAKLKRANSPKDENLHVCHEHFEENCFQLDLRVKYLGENPSSTVMISSYFDPVIRLMKYLVKLRIVLSSLLLYVFYTCVQLASVTMVYF